MKKIRIDRETVIAVIEVLFFAAVFFGVLFVIVRGSEPFRFAFGFVALFALFGVFIEYVSEKRTREKLENELKNCKEELNNNYIYALRLERENKELKKKLGYNIETENEEINEQPEDSFEYDGKIEIEKEHGNEDK